MGRQYELDEGVSGIKEKLYLGGDYLIKKATTNGGWDILYQDPTGLGYWKLTVPKGSFHGAGPLRLSYVSNQDAILKYDLDKL